MKKLLFILFLLLPIVTNAQILSNNGLFGNKKAPPSKTPSTTNTGVAGSGTQINFNADSTPSEPAEPGMMDSGWEEADLYVSISTMPALALQYGAKPQIMTQPRDAIDVTFIYNFAPKASVWLKYVEMEAKGIQMETESEQVVYDENGNPLYDENGEERTEIVKDEYSTTWEHRRVFWGLAWRTNFGENNAHQVQFGIGTALFNEIKETEKGNEVSNLDTTLLLEANYLWVTHNAAWGVQVTSVHTGSKEKNPANIIPGGYLWIGLVYKQGLKWLN
ncbi:hypothetical protein KAR91_87255 [Candidatus Pacearchaeota archaeon]|nr:hypothetical protein [Candidatus Pacearchaeota archaeon]